jgi:transposase
MDWTGLKLLLEGIEPKRVRRRYKNIALPMQNVSTNAGA